MSEFLRDLWQFMRMRKKYWLLPIILVLMLLGGLVVVSQQSALASLIYTDLLSQKSARPAELALTSRGRAARVCSGLIFCAAPCNAPAARGALPRHNNNRSGARDAQRD